MKPNTAPLLTVAALLWRLDEALDLASIDAVCRSVSAAPVTRAVGRVSLVVLVAMRRPVVALALRIGIAPRDGK